MRVAYHCVNIACGICQIFGELLHHAFSMECPRPSCRMRNSGSVEYPKQLVISVVTSLKLQGEILNPNHARNCDTFRQLSMTSSSRLSRADPICHNFQHHIWNMNSLLSNAQPGSAYSLLN